MYKYKRFFILLNKYILFKNLLLFSISMARERSITIYAENNEEYDQV